MATESVLGAKDNRFRMTCYEIREDQLHVYLDGEIEARKLRQLFAEIGADPLFDCHLDQFWHTRDANCDLLSSDALINIARASQPVTGSPKAIVAFIAKSDLHYGLCRIYSAWADETAQALGVFRTEEEARSWTQELRVDSTAI